VKHDGNGEDVYSGISSEYKWTKNLMTTKFPNTISSGKILYPYLFSLHLECRTGLRGIVKKAEILGEALVTYRVF